MKNSEKNDEPSRDLFVQSNPEAKITYLRAEWSCLVVGTEILAIVVEDENEDHSNL